MNAPVVGVVNGTVAGETRQAMAWGIVNQVVADDQVLTTALEIAHQLAKGPARSFGEAKCLILSEAIESLESQIEKETHAIAEMEGSTDGRAGIATFIPKRTPRFSWEIMTQHVSLGDSQPRRFCNESYNRTSILFYSNQWRTRLPLTS